MRQHEFVFRDAQFTEHEQVEIDFARPPAHLPAPTAKRRLGGTHCAEEGPD